MVPKTAIKKVKEYLTLPMLGLGFIKSFTNKMDASSLKEVPIPPVSCLKLVVAFLMATHSLGCEWEKQEAAT